MNWKAPDEPVVFMHGMGVLAHLLAPGDVFDRIAAAARHRGVRAFAPRVPPYNPTRIRAQAWDHHCRRILAETGSQNLHLIGFSTGGLDARYLVSRLGGAGYAASVTLIATPHRGSALAEYAVALPALVRDPIFAVIDRLAKTVYPESEPDVFGTLAELTKPNMTQRFNPAVPDVAGVPYFSFSAQAGQGVPNPASPLIWPLNRLVYARDGVNDGFVSVESAQWTNHQGTLPADHAQLVALFDAFNPHFDARRFYLSWMMRLGERGSAASFWSP